MRGWIQRPVREQKVIDYLGEASYRSMMEASLGMTWPVPVAGTDFCIVSGDLIPTIRGGGFSDYAEVVAAQDRGLFQRLNLYVSTTTSFNNTWQQMGYDTFPSVLPSPSTASSGRSYTRADHAIHQEPVSGKSLYICAVHSRSNSVGPVLLTDMLWGFRFVIGSGEDLTADHQDFGCSASLPRYTGTGDLGSSRGNYAAVCVKSATSPVNSNHTWNLTYSDHLGNTSETSSIAGHTSTQITSYTSPATWVDHNGFLFPMNSGDMGVSTISNISIDYPGGVGATAPAASHELWVHHPLMFVPAGYSTEENLTWETVGNNFNMAKVEDDACLTMWQYRISTSAMRFSTVVDLVAG